MLGALPLDDCLPVNRKEASMVQRFCYLLIAVGSGTVIQSDGLCTGVFLQGQDDSHHRRRPAGRWL